MEAVLAGLALIAMWAIVMGAYFVGESAGRREEHQRGVARFRRVLEIVRSTAPEGTRLRRIRNIIIVYAETGPTLVELTNEYSKGTYQTITDVLEKPNEILKEEEEKAE